jgi:hypothetical protein
MHARATRPVLALALLGAVALGVSFASAPGAHAGGVVEHDYVGAESCRSCHQAQYDAWAKGPHARAMESLSEHERKDARCQQCHTMVPQDPDPALAGIQCETCHGPGKAQLYFAVPDEKTCARCHTESSPSLTPFVYSEKLERIRHWPVSPE